MFDIGATKYWRKLIDVFDLKGENPFSLGAEIVPVFSLNEFSEEGFQVKSYAAGGPSWLVSTLPSRPTVWCTAASGAASAGTSIFRFNAGVYDGSYVQARVRVINKGGGNSIATVSWERAGGTILDYHLVYTILTGTNGERVVEFTTPWLSLPDCRATGNDLRITFLFAPATDWDILCDVRLRPGVYPQG